MPAAFGSSTTDLRSCFTFRFAMIFSLEPENAPDVRILASPDRDRGTAPVYSICKGLPCGKGLATHVRVDGIEDAQSVDIRNASNGDRIAQILNLALCVGKRRPRGETLVVRIA